MISQDYYVVVAVVFLYLVILWINELTPRTCALKKPFHNFLFFPPSLSFCTSWSCFSPPAFLPHAYHTYLQQCQFYGVITLLVCIFWFSPFPFVKVHCVRRLPCVYLCSFPPPLSLLLGSVITALDSSSDGKCFSIPLSPSLPLNLHLSLFLTKQITSWLL